MAAGLAALWLVLMCLVTLLGVDLPLPARIGICVAFATPGGAAIRRVFLLRDAQAVRALAWSESSSGFAVRLGDEQRDREATLGGGSFRLGASNLYLRLQVGDRTHAVFIRPARGGENGPQMRTFRSLCRRLRWPPREP